MPPRAPCRTPFLYFGIPYHGNSVGYHENDVLSTVIFADKKTFNSSLLKVERIHLLAGIMLYSPPPWRTGEALDAVDQPPPPLRGRWHAAA